MTERTAYDVSLDTEVMRTMEPQTISLPRTVFESNLEELLRRLGRGNQSEDVIVDFSHVSFLIPVAMVAILAKFRSWKDGGKRVRINGHNTCPASDYLKRINFFKNCGLDLPESFKRHDSAGKFVEIIGIGRGSGEKVDLVSTRVAECVAPDLADTDDIDESGPFDYLEYGVSELATNLIQHSKSSGFITAQYTPKTDTVRIGIADYGIGIRRIFRDNASPHWSESMSDLEAIDAALKSQVSSKTHLAPSFEESINAGVGLTLLHEMSRQTSGNFVMASGNGYRTLTSGAELGDDQSFQGVVCGLSFTRSKVKNFFTELELAKRSAGLLSGPDDPFEELFI